MTMLTMLGAPAEVREDSTAAERKGKGARGSAALDKLQEGRPVAGGLRRTHAGDFQKVALGGRPGAGEIGKGAVGVDAVGGQRRLPGETGPELPQTVEERFFGGRRRLGRGHGGSAGAAASAAPGALAAG